MEYRLKASNKLKMALFKPFGLCRNSFFLYFILSLLHTFFFLFSSVDFSGRYTIFLSLFYVKPYVIIDIEHLDQKGNLIWAQHRKPLHEKSNERNNKKLNNQPHGFNCQMSRARLVDERRRKKESKKFKKTLSQNAYNLSKNHETQIKIHVEPTQYKTHLIYVLACSRARQYVKFQVFWTHRANKGIENIINAKDLYWFTWIYNHSVSKCEGNERKCFNFRFSAEFQERFHFCLFRHKNSHLDQKC